MHKLGLFILFAFALHVSHGYAQDTLKTEALFDENNLLKHVESLSSDVFEGRRTGTQGAVKAKKYIINQLQTLKVEPLGETFEQPFSFFKNMKSYDAVNVLGVIEGSEYPEKHIVISAHYDHEGIKKKKIYNGADDNASGVSALFAFAEYFRKYPPKHTVILAAFDAEELGLKGSEYFVNHPIMSSKDMVLNINMDMISRSDKKKLFVIGTSENKMLKPLITDYMHSNNIKLIAGHDGFDGLENWTYASDHANFQRKGIPFLYFGVEDHKDYHKPTDDYDNIHPEFYIEAVKTIISVFEKIDKTEI